MTENCEAQAKAEAVWIQAESDRQQAKQDKEVIEGQQHYYKERTLQA